MKRLIRSNLSWLFCVILLSLLVVFPLMNSLVKAQVEEPQGNISFMPNVIPKLTLTPRTGRNNESFRLSWLNNTFDLELFFNASYNNVTRLFSLKDFEDDFNVTVNYVVNKTESNVQFGWVVENVENVSDFVDSAWFKIEDSSFDYELIEVEEIDSFVDLGYNITRFHLPDNLMLSFEDLNDKGFIIGSQNKTATSVKGFSGKSSWNLDPVTFSAPTMTFTGGTEGSPIDNFNWEFWNASNVSGWNVAWNNQQNDTQFQFDCQLYIGNATNAGWVKDDSVQIVFSDWSSSHWDYGYRVVNGGMTLGKIKTEATKSTEKGVSIITMGATYRRFTIATDSNGEVNFYGSSIQTYAQIDRTTFRNGDIWNSRFEGFTLGISVQPFTMDIYNTYLIGGYEGWRNPATSTFDTLWSFNAKTRNLYLLLSATTFTFKNFYQRNGGAIYADARSGEDYIINGDIDTWSFTWFGTGSGQIARQYEFDLNVTDSSNSPIQNANVTVRHYGQGETQDFSILTGSNGSFATQTLTMGFYNQTGGNSIYDYNPYNITITASGYATKTFNFTLEQKTQWQIALETSKAGFSLGFGLGFILTFMIAFIFALAGIVVVSKKRG